MIKIVFRLLAITVFNVILLVSLYDLSIRKRDLDNGFERKFPPHILSNPLVNDLGVNSYYIAGFTRSQIYLGNTTAPHFLVSVDKHLKDTTQFFLRLRAKDTMWGMPRIAIDSPDIYMLQREKPNIRISELYDSLLLKFPVGYSNLLELHPLSRGSVVGRKIDPQKQQSILFKQFNGAVKTDTMILLSKNTADIFRSDGMIMLQPGKGSLFYVHYYRNVFMQLDTSLNLIYKAKTVDTMSMAAVEIGKAYNNKAFTMSSAPRFVNKAAFCNDSLLFIQSAIRARNENVQIFLENSVIDVYFSSTGQYLFSFYLPPYRQNKYSDIKIHDNVIYAVADHYLLAFRINLVNFRVENYFR